MPSIGETLRDARMRQRLDIADVEQRTKIRAKYLRALENEEFGMLPGPTFVKTFLRTYAEMLGLDPHMLVEEYRANYEGEDELELQPLGPPSAVGRDRMGGPRLGPGMLALLLLVGVVAVLVVIGLTSDDSGNGEASRQETTAQRTRRRRSRRRRSAWSCAWCPLLPPTCAWTGAPGRRSCSRARSTRRRRFAASACA
jgi:cytoskeleton protein RodZ